MSIIKPRYFRKTLLELVHHQVFCYTSRLKIRPNCETFINAQCHLMVKGKTESFYQLKKNWPQVRCPDLAQILASFQCMAWTTQTQKFKYLFSYGFSEFSLPWDFVHDTWLILLQSENIFELRITITFNSWLIISSRSLH